MIRSPINRSGCQPPNSGREFLGVLRTRGKQGLRSGCAGDFLVERSIHKKHEKRKKRRLFLFSAFRVFCGEFISFCIHKDLPRNARPGGSGRTGNRPRARRVHEKECGIRKLFGRLSGHACLIFVTVDCGSLIVNDEAELPHSA